MEAKRYTEFTSETVRQLKQLGYTSVQVILMAIDNPYQSTAKRYQAIVEIIPGNSKGFVPGWTSIDSKEVKLYVDVDSPRCRYVVNEDYLCTDGSSKT